MKANEIFLAGLVNRKPQVAVHTLAHGFEVRIRPAAAEALVRAVEVFEIRPRDQRMRLTLGAGHLFISLEFHDVIDMSAGEVVNQSARG